MGKTLPIELFHGTSTLFLDSIIEHGLGGYSPVKEWNLIELSREIYALSETYLSETRLFLKSSYSFKSMTEQVNQGSLNWQHGNTYLSASEFTAARYAVSKQFGSELLTYIIDFLQELKRAGIANELNNLYKRYRQVFNLLDAHPSPLLIGIKGLYVADLSDEQGGDCAANIEEIAEAMDVEEPMRDVYLQQCNFRLHRTVDRSRLTFWLINVQDSVSLSPKYNLYKILPEAD